MNAGTRWGPTPAIAPPVWSRLRTVPTERLAYDRIVRRNPRHKKIAVVARMRTLAVVLWHEGLAAQEAMTAVGAVA